MPVNPTYPGVYIEEIPSGVHTITGVPTSITAFIGRALRGTPNQAMTMNSYADYERIFGGLWEGSSMSYAVRDFYLNGGSQAIIVRLYNADDRGVAEATGAIDKLPTPATSQNAQDYAASLQTWATNSQNFSTPFGKQYATYLANEAQKAANQSTVQTVLTAAKNVQLSIKAAVDAVVQAYKQLIEGNSSAKASDVKASLRAQFPASIASSTNAATIQDLLVKVVEAIGSNAGIATVDAAFTPAAAQIKNAADAVLPSPQPKDTPSSFATAIDGKVPTQPAATDLPGTAAWQAARFIADAAQAAANSITAQSVQQAVTSAAYPINTKSQIKIGGPDGIPLIAASEGSWGANLQAAIDYANITADVAAQLGVDITSLFNLTVTDTNPGGNTERYYNLTLKNSVNRIDKALAARSQLIAWDTSQYADPTLYPSALPIPPGNQTSILDIVSQAALDVKQAIDNKRRGLGDQAAVDKARAALTQAKLLVTAIDGGELTLIDDFVPDGAEVAKTGLYALEQVDIFNLLCIPPYQGFNDGSGSGGDVDPALISYAAEYCASRRAMLLVDPPKSWIDKRTALNDFTAGATIDVGAYGRNAALFFPRLQYPNLLRNSRIETFAPSGAIAGIFATTDAQRGVWKAPAGIDAALTGVPQLSYTLTDAENGELNPLGINCLRSFPVYGRVVWGARTLRGADQLADDYKYIPVRRTALFIEESLYRGSKWVVFEPNDEPLWAQIRLNVGAFMQDLFRKGAFQGQTPKDAYFVKCDKETTTQNDINLGIVNIVVGFAPLKPAEFVIIQLQQITGQIAV
jgi:uncharacterized protein